MKDKSHNVPLSELTYNVIPVLDWWDGIDECIEFDNQDGSVEAVMGRCARYGESGANRPLPGTTSYINNTYAAPDRPGEAWTWRIHDICEKRSEEAEQKEVMASVGKHREAEIRDFLLTSRREK